MSARLQFRRNLLEGSVEGKIRLVSPVAKLLKFGSALFVTFRIVGFLFGFSLASSFAAYHLLDEYKQASAALQASVEELQISTEKVTLTPLY